MNDYRLINFKELNILFLEDKFYKVNSNTYGTYQFKARVVNEFLGDYLVANIDLFKINEFKNYLFLRKWEYAEVGSINSINQILEYLYNLLEMAIKWKIIDNIEIQREEIIPSNKCEKFVLKRNMKLIENELKRASNRLEYILNT